MRWFRIRKATISTDLRDRFETYGAQIIQSILVPGPTGGNQELVRDLLRIGAEADQRDAALKWLLEKSDRAERVETWNLTMEAAITLLVLVSVILDVAILVKP
jgi:hypothetical protein